VGAGDAGRRASARRNALRRRPRSASNRAIQVATPERAREQACCECDQQREARRHNELAEGHVDCEALLVECQ